MCVYVYIYCVCVYIYIYSARGFGSFGSPFSSLIFFAPLEVSIY